jgi:hypothetical protein
MCPGGNKVHSLAAVFLSELDYGAYERETYCDLIARLEQLTTDQGGFFL